MTSKKDAVEVLEATSRTFFVSIVDLPPPLREAVMSAYLSMRAIDEIEDHLTLDRGTKVLLLQDISQKLRAAIAGSELNHCLVTKSVYRNVLPEVTVRIREWELLAPASIAPHLWSAISVMADRMAYWASNGWRIRSEADLDRYTLSVAGAVGILLSDLWAWYDGTLTEKVQAVGFGRGLQAVNILRNRADDLARGVDFFPDGWNENDIQFYAKRNLGLADRYVQALPPGPALNFCRIPLALAYATLEALALGEPKLTRDAVMSVVRREQSLSFQNKG
jgi:farnesyl-diphosphate farnesyltransferase